jgi:hypothetical protein
LRKALTLQGVERSDSQDVRAFLASERDKLGRVVRALNITMGQ